MLMIEPPPVNFIARMAARKVKKTPSRLTAMTLCQPSSEYSALEFASPPMPALQTAMSTRPRLATTSPIAASTRALSATSTTTPCARKPRWAMLLTVWSTASWSRSQMDTSAPDRAIVWAQASPMPEAPPVMTATFPSRS